jgi:hypothetical protein
VSFATLSAIPMLLDSNPPLSYRREQEKRRSRSRPIVQSVLIAAFLLARWSTASAATITATVTDDLGRLLPDAVVMISPEPGAPVPKLEVLRNSQNQRQADVVFRQRR